MYKNQLQELAQRSCFDLPSYACIREGPDHAPRFKATVKFNGEMFESPAFCSTLRQAEHAAAEVALNVLSTKGPSKALAARVLDETGVYKNLLQETAHRAGLKLPMYTTVRSGPSHVPVFYCTVELAGMSFTGEPAKTKKQAQKNAAMTAWSALKKLSKAGSTSSSSSPCPNLSEFGGNDEQDQVIVARYLATLQPPEMKAQRDRQLGRGPIPARRDVIPCFDTSSGRSFFPSPSQNWAYTQLSLEVPMYQSWSQERASQQQSHLLALVPVPSSSPRPHMFSFISSLFQPDHGQYFLAKEPEPLSHVPGMDPYFYFSSNPIPVPLRSVPQVTIQGVEENVLVEKEWLSGNADIDYWKTYFPSNSSKISPIDTPNTSASLNNHSEQSRQETQEKVEEVDSVSSPSTSTATRLESNKIERHDWSLARLTDGSFRPKAINSGVIKGQNNPMIQSTVSVRGFTPAAIGTTSTTASFSRPETSNTVLDAQPSRTNAASPCSRPWLVGRKNTRSMSCANLMAPAVQIRSVVPVCAAPPSKKTPCPIQEQSLPASSGEMKNSTEEQRREVSAASSEFRKLQL